MRVQISSSFLLLVYLGCESPLYIPSDMSISLAASEAGAGVDSGEGAERADAQITGGLSTAGTSIGGASIGGASASLSDWGVGGAEPLVDPIACGALSCDSHASCVSEGDTERCVCEPRYEGDGASCEAQVCPTNASGEPSCACDEGYEGQLYYELATRSWLGTCQRVSPCQLQVLREPDFIETDDITIGQSVHESCLIDDQSVAYYRYSFFEGSIYRYYGAGGTESVCATGAVAEQRAVDSWPYDGGVLNDDLLYHLPELSYSVDACSYELLIIPDNQELSRAYLAPVGRACSEGERVSISCGLGACRADGYVSCEGGEWVERCNPEPASTEPDLCDQLDSDCDGQIDEDFASEITSCGLGLCASTGQTRCETGRVFDSCAEGAPQGEDRSCDDLDQDCDGRADEAYQELSVSCGEGACRADGVVRCQEGSAVTLCTPEPPAGSDASCDGLDQDCDGLSDEHYVGLPVSCGVGACFYNGLTRCVDGVAEELCTPLPAAEEDASCDGLDDDCDERIDEDFSSSVTSCGVGVCQRTGRNDCLDGVELNDCTVGAPTSDDANCDGLDDDCDGLIDEGFVSTLVPCEGSGEYECPAQAPLRCEGGQTTFDCAEVISTLSDESCDGVDDDCDGTLDEAYVSVEVSCGQGVCADSSTTSCVDGVVTDRCQERSPSGDDSDCDGRDDDCDGLVDEAFTPHLVSCGSGLCSSVGQASCEEGVYREDCEPAPILDVDESECNGVDDDCDGRVDETFLSERTFCGDGVCFALGSSSCLDGLTSSNCEPLPPTGNDADCDGIDQDCDAVEDESYPPVIDACGTGVCFNTAASSCVEGVVQNNCVPLPEQGNDSLCDGLDQDCDDQVDESYTPVPTTCVFGSVCVQPGLTQCVGGSIRDVCDPPSFYTGTDNSCDNQDNDCDGRFDEAFVGGIYYCGTGVCRGSGFRSCVNGVEGGGNCQTSSPTGDDSDCNGVDEDCDGRVDESYGTTSTSCGTGVCRRTGTKTCSNGSFNYNCSAGDPTGPDNTQDGLDNDCDGRTDEDAIPPETNCNGLDDDNDNSIDEGYGVRASTCGSGVCASTGTKTCVNGSVQDSCSPNVGNDNDCDNQDEDCDGSTDEHYNGGSTSCGVGACARTGALLCSGGSVSDSCSPGSPGNDNTNNGVDDDCDGSVDEHVVVVQDPVGSELIRCDFSGGSWYTTQIISSGLIFYSAGLECYRSAGPIYAVGGRTFIDGTADFMGTCTNICR